VTDDAAEIRLAFANAIVELGRRDTRVVVLDGDLGNSTRTDLFADSVPGRFFQMGIAEQNMIGVAAGLAATGLRPIAVTFAAFATTRDLDQVRVMVAQTSLPVVIVGSYAGILTGRTGKTHQCIEDLAVYRTLPGMTVLAPGDGAEVRSAMAEAVALGRPTYVRLPRDPSPPIFPPGHRLRVGGSSLLLDGTDVGFISTGVQTYRTLEAAKLLANEGVRAAVLHLPSLKPIDEEAVVRLAERTMRIVTTEDHSVIGGLGGAVSELLGERHPTLMRRVGIADEYSDSAPNDALLLRHGLDPLSIVAVAREILAQKSS
jgi:transketolase